MTTEKKPNSKPSTVNGLEPPDSSEQQQTNDQQIRQLAYHLWQERGCPADSPEEDWYRAEQGMVEGNGKSRAAHHE